MPAAHPAASNGPSLTGPKAGPCWGRQAEHGHRPPHHTPAFRPRGPIPVLLGVPAQQSLCSPSPPPLKPTDLCPTCQPSPCLVSPGAWGPRPRVWGGNSQASVDNQSVKGLGQLLSGLNLVICRTGTGPVLPAWTPSSPNNPDSAPHPTSERVSEMKTPQYAHVEGLYSWAFLK